jgi:hypothetical protein
VPTFKQLFDRNESWHLSIIADSALVCTRANLEQIQFLLGHASIQTTERYLGSRQNFQSGERSAGAELCSIGGQASWRLKCNVISRDLISHRHAFRRTLHCQMASATDTRSAVRSIATESGPPEVQISGVDLRPGVLDLLRRQL